MAKLTPILKKSNFPIPLPSIVIYSSHVGYYNN